MSAMDKNWEAEVVSRVFAGPVNEDGETPDQLVFFVRVTNDRGDRFASVYSWDTTEMSRDAAECKATRFMAKVVAGLARGADPVRSDKWSRSDAMYGSMAYAIYGQAEEVMWEKKDAEVEAFAR